MTNIKQKTNIDLRMIRKLPYRDIMIYFRNFIKGKNKISCFKIDEKEIYTFKKESEDKNIFSLDFSDNDIKIKFYTEKLSDPKMYKFSAEDIREFINGNIVVKNNLKFIDFFVNISMYKVLVK